MKKISLKQRLLCSVSVILSFQLIVGCMASFPGNQLPAISKLPDKSAFVKKPSVYLKISYNDTERGAEETRYIDSLRFKTEGFAELVEKITKESQLFNAYTTDQSKANQMNYTIQMNLDVNDKDSLNWTVTKLVLTSCTLFFFPFHSKSDYHLTARLIDNYSGQELKTYQYDDYESVWISPFLIPFVVMGADSDWTVVFKIKGNMIKNLYNDIEKDKLLLYSHLDERPGYSYSSYQAKEERR